MEVKQLFDILRKEAECSFCIHPFNKPKTLPCLHSFCLDCLNKYAATRRKQGHTTFDCPECLATFQLPDNDKFDAFQTGFHKNRLLDILALEKSGTDQQKNCDNCDRNVAAEFLLLWVPNIPVFSLFRQTRWLEGHSRAHRQASLQNLQTADIEALIQRPVLCDKQYTRENHWSTTVKTAEFVSVTSAHWSGTTNIHCSTFQALLKNTKSSIIKYVEEMKSRVSEYKQEVEKSKKHFGAVEQQIELKQDTKHKWQWKNWYEIWKNIEASIMRELDEVHQTLKQVHLAELENFELSLTQLNNTIEYAEAIMRRNMGPEILQTEETITQRCDELLIDQNFTPNSNPSVCVWWQTTNCVSDRAPVDPLGELL